MTVHDLPGLDEPILSYAFFYNDAFRVVDNVTVEENSDTLIGYEVSKNGVVTNKIKRYSLNKIYDLMLIEPVDRNDRPEKEVNELPDII